VTDAVLEVGGLDPLAFDPPLDPARIALPAPAAELLAVARAQMADAIRRLAARRGLDPADHALVAFGGAGGQHAAPVADQLGIRRVLVHPAASVLCAWGQALARREETRVRSVSARFPDDWPAVTSALAEIEDELPPLGEVFRTVGLRHVGTDHPIEVSADGDVRRAFVDAHRARYGFDRDLPIDVAWVRVRVAAPPEELPSVPDDPFGLGERVIAGPARLDAPTTSVIVPEGWSAARVRGVLALTRAGAPGAPSTSVERTPAAVAVWASRFQAVATSAGAVLERTARSVNIRDRRDFSCAIFDAGGYLVANAPHVPVHLGAMGETVRDLLRRVPVLDPDQHWLTNDPAAGGSHLPDLTVVTPVEWDGARLFVACRAHHVDVGGTTPGSMPPRSTSLADEGFVVRHLPLIEGGRMRDLAGPLAGCRQLDTVRADLEAQIACNVAAARWLRELGPGPVVRAWAGHLLDVASDSVGPVLDALPVEASAEDALDGLPLRVALTRSGDRLVVDFAGTGGPHRGNLNAPIAVVRAAVLYGLRVLAGRPIPLNEGVLRRVEIRVPPGSLVDPPAGAAVAGGNVETSQRLVDLILRAAGYAAASAGSMSNLTLGGPGWSLYETVGGGQGASPRGPGPSGRQLHLTNTRATDPEVLEDRLPVRVRSFRYRAGTGGDGLHRGGDGLVRELEVLAPATAALLASRRDRGAPGLGGGDGAPGADRVRVGGVWRAWDGDPVELAPGDRVEVGTPGGGGWSR
jgi:5-oxoprolinase (ATP-hydrolysing)